MGTPKAKSAAPLFLIEDLLRRGRTAKAKAELLRLCRGKLRRDLILPAAALARRLEMGDLGVRLLHPLVRPQGKRALGEATALEKAEYAANLVRLGACQESLEILSSDELRPVPERDLYSAFALVGLWDYEGSISCLERYLTRTDTDTYQRLVARTNLAAALVHERRHEAAAGHLDELEQSTRAGGYHLLLGHVIKLRAESALGCKDWKASARHLERAEAHMREAGALDTLFLRKWRAVLRLAENTKTGLKELEAVRKAALQLRHWETVRTCDALLAVARADEALLWDVYFGTPFPSFRDKLLRDYGWRGPIPAHHTRRLGRGKPCDLTGWAELCPELVSGDGRFRLLRVLASDAYRPFRTATLFQLVFPGEYYNPQSSPPRIRNMVLRLRQALEQADLKLDVRAEETGYRLYPHQPIVVSILPLAETRADGLADRAARHFGGRPFAMSDAVRALGVPERTCLRALQDAVAQGRLLREGKGRGVKYRFR